MVNALEKLTQLELVHSRSHVRAAVHPDHLRDHRDDLDRVRGLDHHPDAPVWDYDFGFVSDRDPDDLGHDLDPGLDHRRHLCDLGLSDGRGHDRDPGFSGLPVCDCAVPVNRSVRPDP